MKFFQWLKEEIVNNWGIGILALVVSFVGVIIFNMLTYLG